MNFHLIGLIGLLIVSSFNLQLTYGIKKSLKLQDEYWGPGEYSNNTDESIRPFKIVFDKQMIDDLKMRLNRTRDLQPTLEKVGWSYGINSRFMPTVVDYWLNKYDFQKRAEHLNKYPQFLTNIQGLDIHYIHVKPKVSSDSKVKVLPLYIQHGWPGSVVEFYEIIPLLTTVQPGRDFVFEVIAPSLPGFGYSSATTKAGLGPDEMAHVMKNLMLRLGFTKWYTQAGDWGVLVTDSMAIMYPEHILGMHSNWCLAVIPTVKLIVKTAWNVLLGKETKIADSLLHIFAESAYIHAQNTKPETIGIGLSDSPVGLAAYILEKFATASGGGKLWDHGYFADESNLLEKFTMDELLDNIMLYWAPNKPVTSFRIFAEYLSKRTFIRKMFIKPIVVPSACVQFPTEVVNVPEEVLRGCFVNMVSFTKMSRGGRFGAMESPQPLADDIWTAVKKMREYNGTKTCIELLFFSYC